MPGACVPVAAGGLIQRPDRDRAGRELGEPVDVPPAKLVGEEERGSLDQRVLAGSRGEQERRRVDGGDEGGIDPQHGPQTADDLTPQGQGVQPRVAALEERVDPALRWYR